MQKISELCSEQFGGSFSSVGMKVNPMKEKHLCIYHLSQGHGQAVGGQGHNQGQEGGNICQTAGDHNEPRIFLHKPLLQDHLQCKSENWTCQEAEEILDNGEAKAGD